LVNQEDSKLKHFFNKLHRINSTSYTIMISLAIMSIVSVVFIKEFNISKYVISTLMMTSSILLAIRCRKAKMLFLLTSLIAYITISAVMLHYFFLPHFKEVDTFWFLCTSQYSLMYARSMLLTITILGIFLTPNALKKAEEASVPIKEVRRKNNPIISYVGLLGIAYILIFCITRSSGSDYVANTNSLYEYGILVFLMVWYYSKENKIAKIILAICSVIYIAQALFYGVRSSAFILGGIIFMMALKKSPGIYMVLLTLAGIVSSNLFIVYRNHKDLSIIELLQRFFTNSKATDFFSVTAGDSYYTGIGIVASRQFSDAPLNHLFKFVISIFTGGRSSLADGSVIENFTKTIIQIPGGGIYPAYFYFYGEYIGVVLGAVLLGLIIRWYYTHKTSYHILATYLIAVFSLRWFLYSPLPLFRMCIVVYSALFFLCYYFDKLYVKYLSKIKSLKRE